MLTLESPVTGKLITGPKTGRRPLQPIRSPNLPPPPINSQKPNPKLGLIKISEDCNKENANPNYNQNAKCSSIRPVSTDPVQIEQFEVSLADELSAIREKMERLRSDKERTEKMLRERELAMDMKMKELHQRGEIQKTLEMEVDRLYRLNELRSLCNRILPIRSLREKEHEKIKPDKSRVKECLKENESLRSMLDKLRTEQASISIVNNYQNDKGILESNKERAGEISQAYTAEVVSLKGQLAKEQSKAETLSAEVLQLSAQLQQAIQSYDGLARLYKPVLHSIKTNLLKMKQDSSLTVQ